MKRLRKNTVFGIYLSVLVAVNVSFSLWTVFRCRSRVSEVARKAEVLDGYFQTVSSSVEQLREAYDSFSSAASSISVPAPAGGSDASVPDAPEPSPEAEPRVLGIGQNGVYAYADVQYPDGQVLRQYTRLPEHLRRGHRK